LACFHKFFLQLCDIIGDYWTEYGDDYGYYNIGFTDNLSDGDDYGYNDFGFTDNLSDGPKISDIDGFQPIQQDLFSNLESLIPGYFSDLSPSAADDEKFQLLVERLEKEWRHYSPKYKRFKGPNGRYLLYHPFMG
jgi:hypothetical protein